MKIKFDKILGIFREADEATIIIGDGVISGTVTSYANLPDALEHIGKYYIVDVNTGTWILGTLKSAGIYKSNGSTWAYIDSVPETTSLSDGTTVITGTNIILEGSGAISTTTDILNNKIIIDSDLTALDGNGVISGMQLSINTDNTKFNIPSGIFHKIDGNSEVYAGATAQTLTYLNTNNVTYIAIDVSDNSIVQQTTPFLMTQRRSYVLLGAVIHSNLLNINAINNLPDVALYGLAQFNDLLDGLKNFNKEGNIFSANGANLFLNKSAGKLFKKGVNYTIDPTNPHVKTLDALVAPSNIRYRLSDGTEYGDTQSVSLYYESSTGVRSLIPSSRFSIQRITVFSSNLVRIQYGQETYSTMALARQYLTTEPFIVEQNIAENGLLRGYLIVRGGTTNNLTDDARALFIVADKFGEMPLGASGSTTSLQQAYDNSITPEIVTNSTLGAISVQNGNLLDTNSVLETKNIAGTTNFSIDGNGNITSPQDIIIYTPTQKTLFLGTVCYRDEYVGGDWVPAGGGTAPDLENYTMAGLSTRKYAFNGTTTEERLSNCFEIPHDYKDGAPIEVHIHWRPSDNNAGNVEWFFDWEYSEVDSAPVAQTSLRVIVPVLANQQYFHKVNSFIPLIDNGYKLGDIINFTLRRTPNSVNDTYNADAILEKVAMHVPVDTLGSRQMYVK